MGQYFNEVVINDSQYWTTFRRMLSTSSESISIASAEKNFGRTRALAGINLNIQAGECVALLGASGSGKTTLLRSICGLELLDGKDSKVALFGQSLQTGGVLSPEVRTLRRQTGIIFQQFNLVGRMSLLRNVLTGLLPHMPLWRVMSGAFTTEQVRQALQALDSVGLADYAFQRASTLSGGQQQRAAVARALLQGALILLADEPVASLDPESARRVMQLLKQLNQENGMTLVVSLHNVAIARQYCSRIVALRAGAVVFDGPPAALTDTHLRDLYGSHSDELLIEEVHVPLSSAHRDIPFPL